MDICRIFVAERFRCLLKGLIIRSRLNYIYMGVKLKHNSVGVLVCNVWFALRSAILLYLDQQWGNRLEIEEQSSSVKKPNYVKIFFVFGIFRFFNYQFGLEWKLFTEPSEHQLIGHFDCCYDEGILSFILFVIKLGLNSLLTWLT